MKECISINQKTDKIVIKISETEEYKEIIDTIKNRISQLKKMYQNEKTPILVMGRILTKKEMEEIKEIIYNTIPVEVKFDSPTELGLHGIIKTFEKEIENSDTKFLKGSLRSGQKVEYEGSIVLMGDLNAGAEIMAGDNIVVMGNLRGLAHAGAKGNKKAVIAAQSIETPQIRIANIIKEIEKKEDDTVKKKFAYVEEDKIILE